MYNLQFTQIQGVELLSTLNRSQVARVFAHMHDSTRERTLCERGMYTITIHTSSKL